jgi:hypothetical protein
MPTPIVWNPQVKKILKKYDVAAMDYEPTQEERATISSTEYSFYQAWHNRPDTATKINGKKFKEQSWLGNVIGGIENATLTDWICELVQNAFDQDAKNCELLINKVEGELKFRHNGLPIRGPESGRYIGDVVALMEVGISLKSFDLKSEGRYGVGFKYWKHHFEEASLSSGGLTMSWDKDWKTTAPSRIKKSDWTEFNFCRHIQSSPLELDTSSLERLRNAIRMRPSNFEMKVRTIDSDGKQSFSWKHEMTQETDFNGIDLLSFKDEYDDLEQVLETTLMRIKMNSPVFSSDISEEIRVCFTNAIEELQEQRMKLEGNIPIKVQRAVDDYFSDSFLVLGVFHEEDAKGELLSLFPISAEGKSESRISFDAPFDIKPDRLNLKEDKEDGKPKRNRVLIKMLLTSYGNLLKAIQSLPDFLPEDLIDHLLNHPPGCGETSDLDIKVQDFSIHETCSNDWRRYTPIWEDPPDTQDDDPSELLGVDCWPLSDGTLMQASTDAKPLDRDLADYILANPDDAAWVNQRLEGEAIIHRGVPVWNWILKEQSKLIGYSGISIDVPDDWPAPSSLLNHLTQQKKWPPWLPTITLGLDGQGVAEWDANTQVAFLLNGADESLDPENSDLREIIENSGQRVVMLAKELKPLFDSLSEDDRTNAPTSNFHKADDLGSDDEIRRALLTHVFEDADTFPDDSLRAHVGTHNQKDRFPILTERTDLEAKPLLLVPQPGKFWESVRLNVTQKGEKLWFPSNKSMRGGSTSLKSVPPSVRELAHSGHDVWSFYPLQDNDDSLTVARRPDTRTPNVIHWDHDFHPPELIDAMKVAIQHLRESSFNQRNHPIQLSGKDDAVIGLLSIIAPDTNNLCKDMIKEEKALKLPRLLNTCYMPSNALIKKGFENEDGDRGEIWTHGSNDWHQLKADSVSYKPTLGTPEQEWPNHLANVTNPLDLLKIRGMGEINDPDSDIVDIWDARLNDEGGKGNINYGVLCRDLRLDHAIMESARGDEAHLETALEVSSRCLSRLDDISKIWLFEGYWSRVGKRKWEFRVDKIGTSYDPNITRTPIRYVGGQPRISTARNSRQHPHFSDLSVKGVLGFHMSTTKLRSDWEIEYLDECWVPCIDPPSKQLKLALDAKGLSLVQTSQEAFNWSMQANISGTPWKNRLQTLCQIAVSSPANQQNELLELVNSMLNEEQQRTSPGNSSSACRLLLKSLDDSIIVGFPFLVKLMSGTTRNLVDVIQEANQDKSLAGNDLINLFDNIRCCNWLFDRTSSQFKASEQLGLAGRLIRIISHRDAQILFNMPSTIRTLLASDGEWKSNRYALDDGAEIVIVPPHLIDRLVAANSQLEEIKTPELNIKLMNAQVGTPPSLGFINSLIRLTQMMDKMYEPLDDFKQYLKDRPQLTIINGSKAAQENIPITNGILSVGDGGWLLDSGSNHLVYGALGTVPSEESIDLLKDLMLEHRTLDTDIIETSTKNPKKAIIAYQNLMSGAIEKKQRAELTISHMDKEAPNPWCNRDEYDSQFFLSNPRGELEIQKPTWSNSDNALEYYLTKKETYLNQLHSGPISIPDQNRRMLEAMYEGRPCIIDGISPIVTDSDDILGSNIYPHQKVTISQDMIGDHPYYEYAGKNLTGEGLLGNTLLVSGGAAEPLRRTLDNNRLDFNADFINLLLDTINQKQWDRSNDFVLVDGAFVNSITKDRVGIHLHKLHLLHIAALYSAVSEMVM